MEKCIVPPCDPAVQAVPQSLATWDADRCDAYDVARGTIADLRAGRIGVGYDSCVLRNGSGPPYGEALDAAPCAATAGGCYYLVRARDACGSGGWSSSGRDVVPWDDSLSGLCPGQCAPDPTCNDNDPCTTDYCDSGDVCRHVTDRAIDAMNSHALTYGDSAYFTAPALFDSYLEIFQGYHLAQDDAYNQYIDFSLVQAEVSGCWGDQGIGDDFNYVCISSVNPDAGQASDDDGHNDWPRGTVFYVGSTSVPGQHARSHVVTDVRAGTGTAPFGSGNGCAVGTYRLTVAPPIDSLEGLADGEHLSQIWTHFGHPSPGGAYLLGYRLGYGSRLKDGKQGPNLLRNGDACYSAVPEGWTKSGGTFGACGYENTINSGQVECWQGTGGTAGIEWTSAGAGDTLLADPIDVVPGERYVLAGTLDASLPGDRIGLFDDREQSGVYTLHPDLQWDWRIGPDLATIHGRVLPFWRSWVIPEQVHSVRPGMASMWGGEDWYFDDWSLREVTTWLGDDSTTPAVFLINDPGTRNIVITGDSWAGMTNPYSSQIKAGLGRALYERYGVSYADRIIVTGQGGSTSDWILSNDAANCNGSCWDARVAAYNPLYLVVITGVNDASADPPVSVTSLVGSYRAIATKCALQGIIPIFVTPNPIGSSNTGTTPPGEGPASMYERTHEYRDALRATFLDGPLSSPCLP
jgi:hypothetical protein